MTEFKYNFVYQTKNLINGKTYIGVHGTNKLNDGYIGCGIKSQIGANRESKRSKTIFSRAVAKYGYENFKREILGFFDTYEECLEEEKYLVNENWIKRNDNYNLVLGGKGRKGWKMGKHHRTLLTDMISKEYVVVNLKTNEIFYVKNLNDFSRNVFSLNRNPFTSLLSGKSKTYNKIWWACYKENWKGYPEIKSRKKHVILNPSTNRKKVECKITDFYLYQDGKQYKFKNIKEASIYIKVSYSSICYLLKGKIKSSNGFTLNDYPKSYDVFISPTEERVYIHSIIKFAKENQIDCSSFFKLKRGVLTQYKGWKYYETVVE